MLRLLFIAGFLLAGCGTLDNRFRDYDCKYHAIITALAFKDDGAEIAYGLARSSFHAQAVIRRPDGTIEWLESQGHGAYRGKKHRIWTRVIDYVSVEDALIWWLDCELVDYRALRARAYKLHKKMGGLE